MSEKRTQLVGSLIKSHRILRSFDANHLNQRAVEVVKGARLRSRQRGKRNWDSMHWGAGKRQHAESRGFGQYLRTKLQDGTPSTREGSTATDPVGNLPEYRSGTRIHTEFQALGLHPRAPEGNGAFPFCSVQSLP